MWGDTKRLLGGLLAWLLLLVAIPFFAYVEEWSWAALSTILMGYQSVDLKNNAENWRARRKHVSR